MGHAHDDRARRAAVQLSMNLQAIISQRLVPGADGRRAAAVEILLGTPFVRDLIKKGEVHRIKEAMERDVQEGCQTFDLALLALYRAGRITAGGGSRQRPAPQPRRGASYRVSVRPSFPHP